ncbi:GNAT family acetyltransferase [Desulforamulus aeronauticus]|uniref:N-acetyltransferase domain-containing protein n=1 Tax=Desulforamulus aeronauticus DSM 10349 TaxID=1121421 RepID=A0A1M6UPD7_9FIRM|nr:GNAT family acetyltransferase [Desulforamulus aeronauticus]SHK71036.1 hypothetical protein SAMN02745123_02858 [Desulforamulus aeronauticus DSM 10349]
MIITQATMDDFEGILSLIRANHINYISERDKPDGFVTTNFTDAQLEALIVNEHGVTIAKENGKVLSFAMAASWEFWVEWPFFACMIEKLPEFTFEGQTLTRQNSYQYGPICIDKSVRGTGLFERVFYASLASMRERYPIMATFINQINHRSYAAHTKKVPLMTLGTFQFNQNDYYLMACSTALTQK